jgi:ABC-type transport system involved in multi-copper enzyme maturation permease subunit
MLKTIIKKELLESIFSYRFPLFALISILLIPLGLYVNQIDHNKRVRDYNEQQKLANEAVAAISMQDLMAGTVAVKGFRPPGLLSVFAQGFESALPRYYEFTQDGFKPGESSSGDESILSVQGKVDFVFLVQMVISLIGLLFAADTISGEKESGTLRAMLSNRLPRDTILVGKLSGGSLALWIPLILAFLLGIMMLLVGSFPFFSGDTPVRLLIIFLSTSFFILIYYTIGMMISTSSSKTRTSVVAILLIWAFFQLIIPKLSDMLAALVYPVRTETEVSLEESLLAKSVDNETAKELGRQFDNIFSGARAGTADDPASPERKKWDAVKGDIEQRARERKSQQIAAIDETYRQQKQRQQNLAVNLSLVSPSAAFARFIADVCATGEIERTNYIEAVKAHQKALDNELFSKVKRTVMISPRGGTSLGFSVQPVDFQKLPKFSVAPSSLAETFKENWRSLVSLAFWLIAPFAVAYVRFLRYDVR